jgi:hypothetical protein
VGGNAAETDARPAVEVYTNGGANVICKNGDGGFGPDNRQPWFVEYLDVPGSFSTSQHAAGALKAANFDAPRVKAVAPYDGVAPPAGSFEVASDGAKHLAFIDVYPSGSAPLFCTDAGIDYGKPYTPKAGRALVVVQVSSPNRQ